jgi:chemotaxis protein methyltransferase CheR
MGAPVSQPREFELTDKDFARIQAILKQRSGIDVGEGKRLLVYGRLARRLRALGLRGFKEYLELIEDPSGGEAKEFLNALTTNVTEFFRESHHFDFLRERVIPESLAFHGEPRLRIWSSACSTGEEPHSIAMTLMRAGILDSWDARILATDIDSDVLRHAQRGVYSEDKVKKLKPEWLKYFLKGQGNQRGSVRVKPELQEIITFRELNLLGQWPLRGPFDLIFCRNVVIYFDIPTRESLVKRFVSLLRPGGYLFMGHSESLAAGSSRELEPCGKTAYRKRSDGGNGG